MNPYKIGVIQLDTTDNKEDNLRRIRLLVEQAHQKGCRIVALPEVMNVTSIDPEINRPEPIPGYTTGFMGKVAKEFGIWIHCGSIREENPDGTKPFNTTVMIDPAGNLAAKYRKLHLFDVEVEGGPNIQESAMNSKGSEMVLLDTELGKFGFALCYDMRFPELFRLLALGGAQVVFVPANFTKPTGEAHWHTLLRARAIENGVYIVAPAQTGEKPRFTAYGHSMVIDPWGRIIAEIDQGEGLIVAEIDPAMSPKIQNEVGSLKNRRTDLYSLTKL